VLDKSDLRAVELDKTVDQRGEVKKNEEKVEYQTRVGVILVPLLFDEGDRLYRQKKTRSKQDRDDAEKGDEKAIGPIISFAEKHVEGCESCAEKRHEESGNRRVIGLSEMQKFHVPQPRAKFVLRILWNRSLVKRRIPDHQQGVRCKAPRSDD
jgi:hypothetical protein